MYKVIIFMKLQASVYLYYFVAFINFCIIITSLIYYKAQILQM